MKGYDGEDVIPFLKERGVLKSDSLVLSRRRKEDRKGYLFSFMLATSEEVEEVLRNKPNSMDRQYL